MLKNGLVSEKNHFFPLLSVPFKKNYTQYLWCGQCKCWIEGKKLPSIPVPSIQQQKWWWWWCKMDFSVTLKSNRRFFLFDWELDKKSFFKMTIFQLGILVTYCWHHCCPNTIQFLEVFQQFSFCWNSCCRPHCKD